MPKRIMFFSDIDDTLIQTKRKTDFQRKTIVGSYNKNGEEGSYFYEGTKIFIDTLIDSNINFIPTTARNLGSYKRTVFYNNLKIKYAILNFGGLILCNNEIDTQWGKNISQKYSTLISLDILLGDLNKYVKNHNLNLEIKIIDSYYISIYNRENLDNVSILKKIKECLALFIIENNQFYIYENDNSFGILPNFLNKSLAVEYLIKKHQPILTIGAGDNISDLAFMNCTDFKLSPVNCFI